MLPGNHLVVDSFHIFIRLPLFDAANVAKNQGVIAKELSTHMSDSAMLSTTIKTARYMILLLH